MNAAEHSEDSKCVCVCVKCMNHNPVLVQLHLTSFRPTLLYIKLCVCSVLEGSQGVTGSSYKSVLALQMSVLSVVVRVAVTLCC